LRHDATTGDGEELPEAFRVNGKGLPLKLFTLRQKLYQKAKREPKFRFYALYDRICRQDVLEAAWAQVADNDGKPGVDGVSIEQIESSPGGRKHWWRKCTSRLRRRRTDLKRCGACTSPSRMAG
jgi:RNA-directed DNA polymerase